MAFWGYEWLAFPRIFSRPGGRRLGSELRSRRRLTLRGSRREFVAFWGYEWLVFPRIFSRPGRRLGSELRSRRRLTHFGQCRSVLVPTSNGDQTARTRGRRRGSTSHMSRLSYLRYWCRSNDFCPRWPRCGPQKGGKYVGWAPFLRVCDRLLQMLPLCCSCCYCCSRRVPSRVLRGSGATPGSPRKCATQVVASV